MTIMVLSTPFASTTAAGATLPAAAFVQNLKPATRASAFGLAQSGLYAVQGLGILAGGAVAQLIGAQVEWKKPTKFANGTEIRVKIAVQEEQTTG